MCNGDNPHTHQQTALPAGLGSQDVVNLGAGTEEEERKGRWKEEPSRVCDEHGGWVAGREDRRGRAGGQRGSHLVQSILRALGKALMAPCGGNFPSLLSSL